MLATPVGGGWPTGGHEPLSMMDPHGDPNQGRVAGGVTHDLPNSSDPCSWIPKFVRGERWGYKVGDARAGDWGVVGAPVDHPPLDYGDRHGELAGDPDRRVVVGKDAPTPSSDSGFDF
ncbi:hypothetical protein CRG98_028626 [Punica granatum]|uniref:Uncharacterized protein n=1 Tax=Punica granatum TaxID=22663 RepID=A0A2I0J444_PUNGR|nr:hypothetical protein CRG98_028626 [Punica granatum]